MSVIIGGLLKPIRDFVHSITYDNGKEFSWHEQVNKIIGSCSYFAKPYQVFLERTCVDASQLKVVRL